MGGCHSARQCAQAQIEVCWPQTLSPSGHRSTLPQKRKKSKTEWVLVRCPSFSPSTPSKYFRGPKRQLLPSLRFFVQRFVSWSRLPLPSQKNEASLGSLPKECPPGPETRGAQATGSTSTVHILRRPKSFLKRLFLQVLHLTGGLFISFYIFNMLKQMHLSHAQTPQNGFGDVPRVCPKSRTTRTAISCSLASLRRSVAILDLPAAPEHESICRVKSAVLEAPRFWESHRKWRDF